MDTEHSMAEDIRTIFLSGLPIDIVYRECHNLFRFMPGFQHCVLNLNGKVPTAFATFEDRASAEACKDLLQDAPFDEGSMPDLTMRVEWAKKNSTAQNKVTTQSHPGNRKRPRFEGDMSQAYYPAALPSQPSGGSSAITTLFVGNLGTQASEVEVQNLFASQPGMSSFKFQHGARGSVAFVDFATPAQAQAAKKTLQGQMLPSSTTGGIRIELAKSSMGRRNNDPLPAAAPAFNPYNPAFAAAVAAAAASPYMNQYGVPVPAPQDPMVQQGMYGMGYMPPRI